MARRRRALTVLLAGLLAGTGAAGPARGAEYRYASPPIVEAGPDGHAVAIVRLGRIGGRIGYSFAAPGAAFTPPVPQGRSLTIDALAVDGAGAGTLLSGGTHTRALTAPPGRAFRAPMDLSAPGSQTMPVLAVDRTGAAVAGWVEDFRLRVAYRRPGELFGAPLDLGPARDVAGAAFTPDGRARVLATTPRPDGFDAGDATLFTLGSDGRGGGAVVAGEAQARALAAAADGRLLAVVSRPGELRAVVIGADGHAGQDGLLVDDSYTHGIEVLGAVLGPGGDAAVAWRHGTVAVAEGDAVAGFAPPRRFGRFGEVASARFAAGARGDAVLAWSAHGYRPRVSLRPAGGRFGRSAVVSTRAAAPPTATMLPDGAALVGWEERTALTTRQVTARVDASGVTRRQVLASQPLVDDDPRGRARCRAARAGALARNRWAVYHRAGGRGEHEVCSLVTGASDQLRARGFSVFVDFLDTVRLAGPLVAWGTITGEDVGTSPYETAAVFVQDTRTGHSPGPVGLTLGDNLLVSDLVLARDGAVAAIACRDPGLRGRPCRRAGRRARVVAGDQLQGSGRVLDRGRSIDPRSLRLRGRRLTWRHAGRLRSATLRRIRLPG